MSAGLQCAAMGQTVNPSGQTTYHGIAVFSQRLTKALSRQFAIRRRLPRSDHRQRQLVKRRQLTSNIKDGRRIGNPTQPPWVIRISECQ